MSTAELLHARSNSLGYFDEHGAVVVDLLPSHLRVSCVACGGESDIPAFQPSKPWDKACRCGARMKVYATGFELVRITPGPNVATYARRAQSKLVGDAAFRTTSPCVPPCVVQGGGSWAHVDMLGAWVLCFVMLRHVTQKPLFTFSSGKPLPANGACAHYKRSFRFVAVVMGMGDAGWPFVVSLPRPA